MFAVLPTIQEHTENMEEQTHLLLADWWPPATVSQLVFLPLSLSWDTCTEE